MSTARMSALQRIPRLAELTALFLVTPATLSYLHASGKEIPVIPILVVAGVLVGLYLVRVAPAQLRAAWCQPCRPLELQRIGLQLVLVAAALSAYVLWKDPGRFLD